MSDRLDILLSGEGDFRAA